MDKRTVDLLVEKAIEAREKSYSPSSGFAVGAALLANDGRIFTGANIENSSYTPTVCAERVAVFTAVHAGYRDFSAIAIVGGKAGEKITELCPPCGVCRQVLAEFAGGDLKVILSDGTDTEVLTLSELLPRGFSRDNLK